MKTTAYWFLLTAAAVAVAVMAFAPIRTGESGLAGDVRAGVVRGGVHPGAVPLLGTEPGRGRVVRQAMP
ncbi:hypothetical protein [Herbidospora daliensis]|uniref:hypothetical protein n=1 Tax=Herbidospora daliensis TaxID=295585 RepID=UPI0012F7EC5D|nr:hypothetical protein [Herbidospora daliensis]